VHQRMPGVCVLTTSGRKPPLRSAVLRSKIALLSFDHAISARSPRLVVAREAFSGTDEGLPKMFSGLQLEFWAKLLTWGRAG
jgi:hypothetical protein